MKTTPASWGSCVGCTRERNWVRQTRGRPSQAEARESSRRFRLEAVPWKPPRSPSSLHQSIVDPSSSPSLPFTTASSPCERERDRSIRTSTIPRGDSKESVSTSLVIRVSLQPFLFLIIFAFFSFSRLKILERVLKIELYFFKGGFYWGNGRIMLLGLLWNLVMFF